MNQVVLILITLLLITSNYMSIVSALNCRSINHSIKQDKRCVPIVLNAKKNKKSRKTDDLSETVKPTLPAAETFIELPTSTVDEVVNNDDSFQENSLNQRVDLSDDVMAKLKAEMASPFYRLRQLAYLYWVSLLVVL